MITEVIKSLRALLRLQSKQIKKPQNDYVPDSEKRLSHLFHWYPQLLPGETVEWGGILSLSISGCSSGNRHDPRLIYFTSERIVWRFYGQETGWEPFTEIPYNGITYIRRDLSSLHNFDRTKVSELYINCIFGVHSIDYGVTFIDYSSDLSHCEEIIRKATSFKGEVKDVRVFED